MRNLRYYFTQPPSMNLKTKNTNRSSKISVIEFDSDKLATQFLNSKFWRNYLHSNSFKESVRLFFQVNYKLNLDSEEQEQVRRIIMNAVAKAFENGFQKS